MEDDEGPQSQAVEMEKGRGYTPNGVKNVKAESRTQSPEEAALRNSRSPNDEPEEEKMVISATGSPGEEDPLPTPVRKLSRKAVSSPQRTLFNHLPDVTEEARCGFATLPDCVYASKAVGNSDQENLDCDCEEDWHDGTNHACGEDSDCINRVTKIECVGTNCGDRCQNQRFQRKQYARVSVIKTERKGYGLRADADLEPNDFVYEYIGEVIGEELFRSRMMKYDDKGLKHFYFMSLTRTEYVDATMKGGLGRFCNHSCNPNCYVDKWVVGDKLRMGIFALRAVKAGEELCFNYNVDRYGANPQECHCGELNCTKILGGKTQTERATKLPAAIIEALGIDGGDHWEASVASRKPRKKKAMETDEEYVNSLQPRALDEDEVGNVMSALRSCKEQWIAVKLLRRLQAVEEERVLRRVVKFHGYEYLKTTLNAFKEDDEVVLQVLDILYRLPRLTRNKIDDAKIEPVIFSLISSGHEDIAADSKRLIGVWKSLEVGYRIPRAKVDRSVQQQQPVNSIFDDRRQQAREAAAAPVVRPPSPVRNAPTGPRSSMPQRNPHVAPQYMLPRRRVPPRDNTPLPTGWLSAVDQRTGRQYYWEAANPEQKSWVRPKGEAAKLSASAALQAQKIQDIINQCAQPTPRPQSASQTPQAIGTPVAAEPKREKWRSWPMEKQRKLYENTIFPYIKHVADKFYKKLPKEDLKKFVKEVNKKIASSDYKHNRVDDPSRITERQQSKVKQFTKEFLDKAVKKHEMRQKERAARGVKGSLEDVAVSSLHSLASDPPASSLSVEASPVHPEDTPDTTPDLKRKRDDGDADSAADLTPGDAPSVKRVKDAELEVEVPSPPPPPTPPPLDELEDADMIEEEEEQQLKEHEDALVRENEEAQRLQQQAAEQRRLREHEEALERENQEALLALQQKFDAVGGDVPMVNGSGSGSSSSREAEASSTPTEEAQTQTPTPNGVVNGGTKMDAAVTGMGLEDRDDEAAAMKLEMASRKREVLGH